MAETEKQTGDPSFKPGVMSPNSKKVFAEMRNAPNIISKQKLVFDEDSFEQRFLKCQLCKEKFNMNDRSPRLLPCHHAFCFPCVMLFYKKEADYRQSLASIAGSIKAYAVSICCPTCQANFISTEDGLKQLTLDHRVVQLLDFVGHTDKQTVIFCSKHSSQPVNFFCEKCVQPICRDCTVIDHKECSAAQLVFDIQGAKKRYTPVLENGVKEMEEEVTSLKTKKEDCETAIAKTKKGDDTLVNDIKEAFSKIRKALDEREQQLIDMAESENGKSKSSYEEKLKKFEEKEKEVVEIITDLNKINTESKIQDMFYIHERVRNYSTEPAVEMKDPNEGRQSTSTFNGRDEPTIISRIANFGDIQTSYSSSSNGRGSSYSGTSSPSTYSSTYGSYSNGGSTYSSRYTSGYTSRYTPRSYNKY